MAGAEHARQHGLSDSHRTHEVYRNNLLPVFTRCSTKPCVVPRYPALLTRMSGVSASSSAWLGGSNLPSEEPILFPFSQPSFNMRHRTRTLYRDDVTALAVIRSTTRSA